MASKRPTARAERRAAASRVPGLCTASRPAPGKSYTIPLAKLLAGHAEADWVRVEGLRADGGTVRDNGDGTLSLACRAGFSGTIRVSLSVSNGRLAQVATPILSVAASDDAPAVLTNGVRLSCIWPDRAWGRGARCARAATPAGPQPTCAASRRAAEEKAA